MDEKYVKKVALVVVLAVLFILTFFILKPILLSTSFGLILAFIFYPLYKKIIPWVKSKNLAAIIICLALLIIITLPLFFITPFVVKQVFNIYSEIQATGPSIFEKILPSFIASSELSKDLIIALNVFAGKIATSFMNSFMDIILNSPIIFLHILLVLFVFFFGLRDGEALIQYLKEISPLSKESEKKVFKQFKDITYSVIFGQIIIGIFQGLVTGIGLLIFGVPNAIVLTLIATFVGIIPIIGPWLVWVPVDIYLFMNGRIGAAIGLLIYGLIVITWIDTLIRPFIVSKKTKINSAVVLVSMVGGFLVFGILGLIIGPLIISYLLLLLEFYKEKKKQTI